MKLRIALLLTIAILGLCILHQMIHPSAQTLPTSWQTIQNAHGHGADLIGSFTMKRNWKVTWTCTTTTTLALQIDSDKQGSFQETVPCDGQQRSKTITKPGTFYVAVTTTGEWTLQIQESA